MVDGCLSTASGCRREKGKEVEPGGSSFESAPGGILDKSARAGQFDVHYVAVLPEYRPKLVLVIVRGQIADIYLRFLQSNNRNRQTAAMCQAITPYTCAVGEEGHGRLEGGGYNLIKVN